MGETNKEERGSKLKLFGVQLSSGGVGVFHMNGWGSKSLVCHSRPRENKPFGWISWEDCRDIPGVPPQFKSKALGPYRGVSGALPEFVQEVPAALQPPPNEHWGQPSGLPHLSGIESANLNRESSDSELP